MHPLVKLPNDIELVLYLIREELKANKLINGLSQAGFQGCYYQSNFSGLVFKHLGFNDDPDDLYQFYYKLINQYTEKIEEDLEVITNCAFNVYIELMIEKKKRLAR